MATTARKTRSGGTRRNGLRDAGRPCYDRAPPILQRRTQMKLRALPFVMIFAAASFVNCGGGGNGSPTAPTPTVTPTSLVVSGNLALTDRGQQSPLTATLVFSDGSRQDQTLATTWTVSNTGVATISSTGVLTAVTSGNLQVTAAHAGFTDSKTVNVAVACELNNTAQVRFENRSAGNRSYDIVWDGIRTASGLAPGQSTDPITVAAGVAHTLRFQLANSATLACNQASPVLTQCSSQVYWCTF